MNHQIRLTNIGAAVAFTALFLLIGWRDINPYGFADLEAYRRGFETQWSVFMTLNMSAPEFILREGLWARGFDALYGFVGDIEMSFTIVSAVAILLMSVFVVRQTGSPWYLGFFLNPAFIELTLAQLRSGLAGGLFWLAIVVRSWLAKAGLLLLACSVHTSFFLFSAFYLAFEIGRRMHVMETLFRRPALMAFAIAGTALLVTLLRQTLLLALEDERAYLVLDYTSGILLAAAWGSFFITYLASTREKEAQFETGFFVFNASMALFSALMGLYGSRFAAIVVPALAVMAARIPPAYRFVFVAQYAAFTAAYFYFWFD